MKWSTLLNKVNFSNSATGARRNVQADVDITSRQQSSYESEQDFKRFWEDFRCAHAEKEKQEALEMALNVFCRLARKHDNPAQLALTLVDPRQFAFVVARAFIADVDRLRASESADFVAKQLVQQAEGKQEDVANVLFVLQSLVAPPLDVQPLLDAGVLSCLIHVLYSFLNLKEDATRPNHRQRLQVEGEVVHILKALGAHAGAAPDDDSLQLLFNMAIVQPETVHLQQLHRVLHQDKHCMKSSLAKKRWPNIIGTAIRSPMNEIQPVVIQKEAIEDNGETLPGDDEYYARAALLSQSKPPEEENYDEDKEETILAVPPPSSWLLAQASAVHFNFCFCPSTDMIHARRLWHAANERTLLVHGRKIMAGKLIVLSTEDFDELSHFHAETLGSL